MSARGRLGLGGATPMEAISTTTIIIIIVVVVVTGPL
jgi:hypothetical protein